MQSQESESESSSEPSEECWIERYCMQNGNEFLCEVDKAYINDRFNLTGLNEMVKDFPTAYRIIIDSHDREATTDPEDKNLKNQLALLYGLIHARFIMTGPGMESMYEKWSIAEFGVCPRVLCEKQHLLPVGLSDECGKSNVKVYCGRCDDIFEPSESRSGKLDGAYFGTGFPHMFYLSLPRLRPIKPKINYEAKLYGFKIHPMAIEDQVKIAKENRAKVFLPKIRR